MPGTTARASAGEESGLSLATPNVPGTDIAGTLVAVHAVRRINSIQAFSVPSTRSPTQWRYTTPCGCTTRGYQGEFLLLRIQKHADPHPQQFFPSPTSKHAVSCAPDASLFRLHAAVTQNACTDTIFRHFPASSSRRRHACAPLERWTRRWRAPSPCSSRRLRMARALSRCGLWSSMRVHDVFCDNKLLTLGFQVFLADPQPPGACAGTLREGCGRGGVPLPPSSRFGGSTLT